MNTNRRGFFGKLLGLPALLTGAVAMESMSSDMTKVIEVHLDSRALTEEIEAAIQQATDAAKREMEDYLARRDIRGARE